jgi:hypothetical protein
MLFIFKYTSNQVRIKRVKALIKGNFLAIALYKESLRVLLSSTAKILGANFRYIGLNVRPLLVMIMPMLLLLVNMDAWYGHRAIQPGESFMLNAELEPSTAVAEMEAKLRVPEGLHVDTPVVRNSEDHEVSWRLSAEKPGDYPVTIEINGQPFDKKVSVGNEFKHLTPVRYKTGWLNGILYPREARLPDAGPIKKIELQYPETDFNLFGWKAHWLWAYFILSLLIAFPLKGPLGVEI